MIDFDYEQEKLIHPENFGDDGIETIKEPDEPDFDMLHDLNAELDQELTEEDILIKLANEEEKERKTTERMDRVEDQKFRWGAPKGE